MSRLVICLIGLLFVSPIMAEERAVSQQTSTDDAELKLDYSPEWPAPPDTTGMLLRLGIGTAFTIAACAGTLIFGRRWLQKLPAAGGSRQMSVEESVNLGTRAALFLIKVGDHRVVAGTDASGLKSLVLLPTMFQNSLDEQLAEPVPDQTEERAEPDVVASSVVRDRIVPVKPAFPEFGWSGAAAVAVAKG